MQRTWCYLSNPFDAATDTSYRAMRKIGKYTLDAVKGKITTSDSMIPGSDNEFFTSLRDKLQPLVNEFEEKYAQWLNQLGQRKGQTHQLSNKLAILHGIKIDDWDLAIRNVHRRGTPAYERLLPNRRTPFQVGSQEDRLAALQRFHQAVSADNALPASLKTEVQTFWQELQVEIESQNEKKSGANNASDAVEAARQALATGLYGTLGVLMGRYERTPKIVANFFNLEMIRSHEQTSFRLTLAAEETKLVMTHNFEDEDELRLVNDGDTALRFFLTENENDTIGDTYITIAANSKKTITISELGDVVNRHLKVKNMSIEGKGHCMVVLV